MATALSASLDGLPSALLEQIALCARDGTDQLGQLVALMRLCKTWREPAERALCVEPRAPALTAQLSRGVRERRRLPVPRAPRHAHALRSPARLRARPRPHRLGLWRMSLHPESELTVQVAALEIPAEDQKRMLEIVGALPALRRLALPVVNIEATRDVLEADNLRTVRSLLLFGLDHSTFTLVPSVYSTTSRMSLERLAIWTPGDPSVGPKWTPALGTFAPDQPTCVFLDADAADLQLLGHVRLRGRASHRRAHALPALAGRPATHLPRPAPPTRRRPAIDVSPTAL